MKYINFTIWEMVMHIIQIQNITLKLIKVKAHSDNKFNDMADNLIKDARHFYLIQLNQLCPFKIYTRYFTCDTTEK